MHVFSRVYAVRGQKKLMFPKGYCVTVRHDFDNESTGRREVVAIFKNRSFVPRGASNPRQAHREKLPSRSHYGRFTFHISLLLFCPPRQTESAKRERGNPFGERSGTGYCYELNEPLRRPPPLLLLPKYLPVGLAAIGIKAITLTLFPSGFQ